MFSQTVEYALRTVVWLAAQQGEARTTHEIARATKIPAGYLAKVLQTLGRAGLVRSRRGVKGGFTLGRPADQISVLDVVAAVDPIRRIERCPLGLESHGTKFCPLHRRLNDAVARVEQTLAETRISDLVEVAAKKSPFCR